MTRSLVRCATAVPFFGMFGFACAASTPPPLHCGDGKLPCADQVTSFRCENLEEGQIPPDVREVRWILSGAKVAPSTEPPVALVARCAGHLDAAGQSISVELFEGFEGGYLKAPGMDRIWFETPPETHDSKRERTCVDEPLPPIDPDTPLECHGVSGEALDARRVKEHLVHATGAPHAWIDTPRPAYGWCDITLMDIGSIRVDLFADGEGWYHLQGERLICFKTDAWK